eukprot:166695-Prymnesium_polylepis.2
MPKLASIRWSTSESRLRVSEHAARRTRSLRAATAHPASRLRSSTLGASGPFFDSTQTKIGAPQPARSCRPARGNDDVERIKVVHYSLGVHVV